MIRDMRDSVSSWPIRIILILLIVSFVSFYGWRSGQGLKTGEVARVNGEPIYARDFSFRYQNVIQNYQRQGRLGDDVPEAIYNLIKQQLLNSMIYQKLRAAEADRLHLLASDEKVKETIKKQFSDAQGNFDFKFYEQFLRNQMGKTPGQYEESERENLKSEMFEQFILETGLASNLQLKQAYEQKNEKVALSYVRLNENNTTTYRKQLKSATDADLKKYFADHADQFKTKEKRKLSIAYFDKRDFQNSSDFPKEAETLFQDESTVAKDSRIKHVETPFVSYEDGVPPLSSGELTEILNSTLNLDVEKNTIFTSRDGQKVYLVTLKGVQPSVSLPFDSVKTTVAQSYQQEKNKEAFETWIQDSWRKIVNGKQTLAAFAKDNKLELKNTEPFEYSSTGKIPSLGVQEELMKNAFKLSQANPYVAQPVQVDKDYAFVMLKSREVPDWKKFDAEKENLASVLHQQSAQTRYGDWMDAIEKKSQIKRELMVPQNDMPQD